MEHLLYLVFVLMAAWIFALFEVQVEGRHGWAANLPTWRIENKFTRMFYSQRPLSGYHFYIQLFSVLIVHLPFALSIVDWSLKVEARLLSFLVLFWLLEDFLWFICNPAYGLKRFRAEDTWWHSSTWWWIAPRDYWLWFPIGVALYIYSWA